jgi:hypothetical protein
MPEHPDELRKRAMMHGAADGLATIFPDCGFVLLVFPFGEGAHQPADYISNATAAEAVETLRDAARRLEARLDAELARDLEDANGRPLA